MCRRLESRSAIAVMAVHLVYSDVRAFWNLDLTGKILVAQHLDLTGKILVAQQVPDPNCVWIRDLRRFHIFQPRNPRSQSGIRWPPRASQRRKGYGRLVVRALCLALADHGIETIGLNVTADNEAAIGMYKALNFHTAMEFVECDVENRAAAQAGI